MGRSGFTVVEEGHLVTLLAPVDVAAATSSEVISMENWSHVTFICMKGVGSVGTVQLEECTSFAGAGAATRVFNYCTEDTASGDTMDAALTAAGTAGIAIDSDTGTLLVIELDADELTDGYPYVRLKVSATGASIQAWLAVLSGGRYQKDITATAIV